MSASARLSLRGQLALYSAAISVVATALILVGLLPLWNASRQPSGVAQPGEGVELALLLVVLAVGILFLVSYLLLVRWIAGPAERLLEATERVGLDLDAQLLAETGPALGRLGTAFGRMEGRLAEERQRVQAQLHELKEMNRALSEARDQAIQQEKLATVGRLAAGVAHEIGNPLLASFGYLELLKADAPAEYVERIERELRRIDRIVRDLLDYARPRGAERRELDLAKVVGEVVRLVETQPRFSLIEVEVEMEAGDAPLLALGDEHYLRQVVLNLLQNAADAMDGAGRIRITIGQSEDGARLRVEDQGPGVPTAELPRIFDPFYSTKGPGKGTGLGLSLCLGWIEAMGGKLQATNLEEGGACFEIQLPLLVASAHP